MGIRKSATLKITEMMSHLRTDREQGQTWVQRKETRHMDSGPLPVKDRSGREREVR